MKQSIEFIKNCFKRGAKPTESNFIDVFDSYLHEDKINVDFYPYEMQVERKKKNGDFFKIDGQREILSIYVDNDTLTPGNISIGSKAGFSDIVAITDLPVSGQDKRLVYIPNYNYPDKKDRKMYVTISSDATVKLQLLTIKLFN